MSLIKNKWLRVLISVGLMVLLLWWLVDPKEAAKVIATADWRYLVLMLVVLMADRVFMAYKWRLLLICRDLSLGLGRASSSYFLATFAGCFLPSTVGADALRIAAVAGPGLPSAELTASVVVERALGFVAAALAALMGLVLLMGFTAGLPKQFFHWALAVLALSALGVTASLSSMAGRASIALEKKLEGRGKLAAWASRMLAAYRQYSNHRWTLAWFFVLTLAEQAALIITNWLSAQAYHIDLSLLEAAAVTPVAILLARLPITVSSFGVMEGLYMAFFGLVGVGPTEAFLMGLTQNLATLASSLPGMAPYLTRGVRRNGNDR